MAVAGSMNDGIGNRRARLHCRELNDVDIAAKIGMDVAQPYILGYNQAQGARRALAARSRSSCAHPRDSSLNCVREERLITRTAVRSGKVLLLSLRPAWPFKSFDSNQVEQSELL